MRPLSQPCFPMHMQVYTTPQPACQVNALWPQERMWEPCQIWHQHSSRRSCMPVCGWVSVRWYRGISIWYSIKTPLGMLRWCFKSTWFSQRCQLFWLQWCGWKKAVARYNQINIYWSIYWPYTYGIDLHNIYIYRDLINGTMACTYLPYNGSNFQEVKCNSVHV